MGNAWSGANEKFQMRTTIISCEDNCFHSKTVIKRVYSGIMRGEIAGTNIIGDHRTIW